MGLRALRHQRRSCDHFFWVLFFTILVVPEQWRCSAGLTDLHILPHEQLHKGRGISEDYVPATRKPAKQKEEALVHELESITTRKSVPQKVEISAQKQNTSTSGKAVEQISETLVHGRPLIASSGEPVGKAPKKPLPPRPRSKKLDIVLSHFHPSRVQSTLDFWLDFLKSDKMQQWEPYVWLYCQNENMTDEMMGGLKPLLQYGGEIVHLENVGRESHSFLHHITAHYGDLADYTLFSQDMPEDILLHRFEKMFDNTTGFLPLAIVGHVDCVDEWLPAGTIPQLYSMLTRSLCPPEGFTAAFQGQFIVSKRRIVDQDWWVYKHLLDMLAAPLDHWVHGMHDNQHFKDRSNPFFGHVLERTWSLAFNCYESWRQGNCWWCDNDMNMENCGTDACQCLERIP